MDIYLEMGITNISLRALLVSPWLQMLSNRPLADWISTSPDAHYVGISLRSAYRHKRIWWYDTDLQRGVGIKSTPSWHWTAHEKKQYSDEAMWNKMEIMIITWFCAILLYHPSYNAFAQLSGPIVHSLCLGTMSTQAGWGIAVEPIYQLGTLKTHYCMIYRNSDDQVQLPYVYNTDT